MFVTTFKGSEASNRSLLFVFARRSIKPLVDVWRGCGLLSALLF